MSGRSGVVKRTARSRTWSRFLIGLGSWRSTRIAQPMAVSYAASREIESGMVRASTIQKRQLAYVERISLDGFDFGLTVGDAFVRSVRNLGYRHCGTALDELIDNSIEAGARSVHVAFGFGDSEAKPTAIATIDDGSGMVTDMIRAAVVWGGTHREGGEDGFGRFGYGLPSASVSQGRTFTVLSRIEPGNFKGLTLDVDSISAGKYVSKTRVIIPKARTMAVPSGWPTTSRAIFRAEPTRYGPSSSGRTWIESPGERPAPWKGIFSSTLALRTGASSAGQISLSTT